MSTSSVLVFRTGSLGDSLVAVPALRAIREHFQGARIVLLTDQQVRASRRYVSATEIFAGTGLVDEFLVYPFEPTAGRLRSLTRMARLLWRLRSMRFGTMVYLAPSHRPAPSVARDRRFFRAAGVENLLGFTGFTSPGARPATGYADVPREADLLLARLKNDGIRVPDTGKADPRMPASEPARALFKQWRGSLAPEGGRTWIGVGAGANQPVNRWPIERYDAVIRTLIERFDVWPVVFGGPEDEQDARALLLSWGRGHLAVGMPPSAAMLALSECALHVGNDTGTIHMAAAAGVPCVGVYSSRNLPGLWFPYGAGHRVLRTPIACENCELFECLEHKMQCILAITPAQVVAACADILLAASAHPANGAD